MMKFRLVALAAASAMICGSFASCSDKDKDKDNKTSKTAPVTQAQDTTQSLAVEDETDAAATEAATAAPAVQFEDTVSAESGDAILAIVDGQWFVQYWGKNTDLLTYDAGVAHITGDGDYTVSVNADTNGFRYDVTQSPDNEYIPSGLEFLAVKVIDGTKLWPNMAIEVKSVRVDGNEVPLNYKNFTSSDDGEEMRANIYNHFVSEIPSDAHDANGPVSDPETYSYMIIDPSYFDSWQKVEVDFSVTGCE